MTLLALLACACPTFEELPVVDPEGVGTAEEVGVVEAAIAEFAGWTAREGVCVDEVEIIEEIDWRPPEATGLYHADDPLAHIWIETGGSAMRRRTLHELCHALDYDEAITDTRRELFSPAEGLNPELYDTEEKRRLEAFARACEEGPGALGLARAFEESCGVATIDPVDRYLADEVFRGNTDLPVTIDAFSAVEGDAVELLLPEQTYALSIVGDADGLLVLTVTYTYVAWIPWSAYATILRVDPRTGAIVGSWRAPFHGQADLSGTLFRRDAGPPVLRLVDEQGETAAFTLDEATGTFTPLPLDAPMDAGGVVTGGVLWYLSQAPDGPVSLRGATVPDGTPASAPPWTDWLTIWDATPTGDALYGMYEGELGFVDLASGAFLPLLRPGSGLGLVGWLDEDRLLFSVREGTVDHSARLDGYVVHDRAAGTWALSVDPCGSPGTSMTVLAAGGAWVVRRVDTGGRSGLVLRPVALDL